MLIRIKLERSAERMFPEFRGALDALAASSCFDGILKLCARGLTPSRAAGLVFAGQG
jgi:hypothetical protein